MGWDLVTGKGISFAQEDGKLFHREGKEGRCLKVKVSVLVTAE